LFEISEYFLTVGDGVRVVEMLVEECPKVVFLIAGGD
jgi:hypothetical protein